jgi:NAD(P)-dependent dehydrogenase (short-subunit alcohol dehydrogenase family)
MVASFMAKSLLGKVAVVAGATRGAGRGIARMLGEAGATVYCTGRSTRDRPASSGRPETIEETADLVTAAGGLGIAVRTDHSRPEEVKALFERGGAIPGSSTSWSMTSGAAIRSLNGSRSGSSTVLRAFRCWTEQCARTS